MQPAKKSTLNDHKKKRRKAKQNKKHTIRKGEKEKAIKRKKNLVHRCRPTTHRGDGEPEDGVPEKVPRRFGPKFLGGGFGGGARIQRRAPLRRRQTHGALRLRSLECRG